MMNLNVFSHLVFVIIFSTSITDGSRPRGVRPELVSMYNPDVDFKCFDSSNTIPFSQVNDDYCDCEDGSDEPGTSACSNSKFYCENAGHKAILLMSSRVGDGICDCCDGSDEWIYGTTCPNTCDELGRAAREAEEARVKVIQEGLSKKQGMVNQAKTLLEEKRVQLQQKEVKKAELEKMRDEKQKLKDEAEIPEKEALDYYKHIEEEEKKRLEEEKATKNAAEAADYFAQLDTDNDGIVTIAELQIRSGLDTNKDGEVTEEEVKFFLGERESFDLDSFKDDAFALIKPYLDLEKNAAHENDKEIIHDAEDSSDDQFHPPDHPMMKDTPEAAFDPEAPDHPMMHDTAESAPRLEEDYSDEQEDVDDEDYDINDHDHDDNKDDVELAKSESKYDEQTQQLIETAEKARKELNEADRELKDMEREIKQLSDSLDKDYGDESVFASLHGQCFDYTDNEYVYKMCPFDQCSQRSKSGGAETRLGSWGEWTGPDHNRHSSMKFVGGQTCWNGPARSTAVYLHCGGDNTLTAVSEPNRCEYEMHFTTPAACYLSQPGSSHDEL